MWLNKKKNALVGAPYSTEWAEYLCSPEGLDCTFNNVSQYPASNDMIARSIVYELSKNPTKYDFVIIGTTHIGWWDIKEKFVFDGNKLLKEDTKNLTEQEKAAKVFNHALLTEKGLYTKYFANNRMLGDYMNMLAVIQRICIKQDIILLVAAWEDPFDWKFIHNYCKANQEHDRNEPPYPYWNFNYERYFQWLVYSFTKTLMEPLFGKSVYDFIYGSIGARYADRNPENPGWKFPVDMGFKDEFFVRYPQKDIPILEQLRAVHIGDDNNYKYFKDDHLETLTDLGSRRIAEIYYEFYKKNYLEDQSEDKNVSNQA